MCKRGDAPAAPTPRLKAPSAPVPSSSPYTRQSRGPHTLEAGALPEPWPLGLVGICCGYRVRSQAGWEELSIHSDSRGQLSRQRCYSDSES